MSKTHSTNFVPSSKPPKCEIVKLVEVTPPLRKIRVDLKESKPKNPNIPKDKVHDRPLWVCLFLWKDWVYSSKLFQVTSCKASK